jgi:succinoglycan biosynthesis transport protein ExoP
MAPPISRKRPAELGGYLTGAPTRKYLIIVLAILGIFYGLYKNATQPSLYSSYGRIKIRSGSSNWYQAGLEGTKIDIVDHAMPQPGPTVKTGSSLVITNTLIALLFGVVLALVPKSTDRGLRGVAEIEAVTGFPSLALIPRSHRTDVPASNARIGQRNVSALSTPESQFSEALRALRTSLLLSSAGSLPKVILLTSATPAEGKTTISTNLACVLAQDDVRVLMIDADLRRPTVHHRLGLNRKIGLTSILIGTATLEQAVQKLPELPNLEVLTSGPVPPFPTEMLGSQTMLNLLEQCRGIYSHIVIDSPPLLSVTDGIVLAGYADAVVMIVRHGRSDKQTVRRARDLLARAGASVTGIAINAVDLSSPYLDSERWAHKTRSFPPTPVRT